MNFSLTKNTNFHRLNGQKFNLTDMFAIIETGGKQYKVEKGTNLDIEILNEKEGAGVEIDKVLLINDNSKTLIGTPYIDGAVVKAKIIAHKKGDKITVFKKKPKKRYERTLGHRQNLTLVEITEIKSTGAKNADSKPEIVEKA